MGGKGGVSLPDYSWLEGAYKEQLAFNKDVYNEMSPYYKGMMEQQIASSEQQMGQAKDYYDYMRNTFRPLEERMVDDAWRQNTDSYREGLARQAAATAQTAFSNTMGQLERNNASMGLGSKLSPAQERAMALGLTAQQAAGAEGARQGGLGAGMAAMQNAAGLGRNLPQNAANAYTGAANATNVAANVGLMPSNQYLTAANASLSGINSLYGTQTQAYNAQQQAQADIYAGLGQMAGSAMGMYGMYNFGAGVPKVY